MRAWAVGLVLCVGCFEAPVEPRDAGVIGAGDAGPDAGDVDSGGPDSGVSHAGGSDAGGSDAGGSDAGDSDAGDSDAGETEAGAQDAGLTLGPLCEKQLGVCAGARALRNDAGFEMTCSAVAYGGSYAAEDLLCDGLDNDCDGRVDVGEEVALSTAVRP